jgi:hypothetical protein
MPLPASRLVKIGQFRHAIYFDGVDDYARVVDSESLHVWGEVTWTYWIKPLTFKDVYQVVTTKWDGIVAHEILVSGLTPATTSTFYAIHRNTAGGRIYVEAKRPMRPMSGILSLSGAT